jgi:ATP-dependent DNA ligase
MNIFNTKPFKAVSFVESAVKKALDNAGYLIVDCKYDGVRGNIVVDNVAEAAWLSRVSKFIPALEHLNGFDKRWQQLMNDDRCIFPDGFMLDGELMVKGVDFNTGSGLLRTKWLKKNNFMFDRGGVEPLQGSKVAFELDYNVQNLLMPYHVEAMRSLLVEYFPEIEWLIAETYEVYDMDSLTELYEEKRAEGHEGLIVKDPQGIYKRGKKSGWWKCKPNDEADGIIQGVNWGTPGLANEGKVIGFSVLLETGRLVDANNISRALMDEFTANVKEHGEDYYNGWACQIGYMEETPDGSLRHPSFTCFRGTEDNPQEKM